jgi:hypothetical protein
LGRNEERLGTPRERELVITWSGKYQRKFKWLLGTLTSDLGLMRANLPLVLRENDTFLKGGNLHNFHSMTEFFFLNNFYLFSQLNNVISTVYVISIKWRGGEREEATHQ